MKANQTPAPLVELAARLRAAIVPLARQMRRAEGELTPTHLSVLDSIHRHEPIALGELANVERLSPAMISRVVGSLEAEGLLERIADRDDRRICRVQITAAGHRWIRQGQAHRNACLVQRLEALDPSDLAALAAAVPILEHLSDPPLPITALAAQSS